MIFGRGEARALLRALFDAAVAAADPARAMTTALDRHPLPTPDPGGRLLIVAFGKAAPAMLAPVLEAAPDATAICVTHHGNHAELPEAECHHAGHPEPDAAGAEAAGRVAALLDGAGKADRVVALISGGGSALLPAPAEGLTLDDKIATARLLLESGLAIEQVNLVRQQLSRLKGGGFLRCADPAPVTAYILSDVVGDDLRAIASGPTVAPLGRPADAVALLRDAGLWDRLTDSVRRHLETPEPPDETVPLSPENHLVGSNSRSVAAMEEAVPQGVDIHRREEPLTGDVADATEIILAAAEKTGTLRHPVALLFGGETTVRLQGGGTGGRNQELALRIALAAGPRLGARWAFLSGGTDGRDGPTDAAGAIVDSGSVERIAKAGENARALLADNDSHRALAASRDLLVTGPTGTNVADVQALILWP